MLGGGDEEQRVIESAGYAAGMRMEPPPSAPMAMGMRPVPCGMSDREREGVFEREREGERQRKREEERKRHRTGLSECKNNCFT
jgi:hypothetical protein